MARISTNSRRTSKTIESGRSRPFPPPAGPYTSFERRLADLFRAFGERGVDEDTLLPYQETVLRDLKEGFSEHAVAALYRWWDYDLDHLRARGSRFEPAKPRIAIIIDTTSRGNLTVEWRPDGTPKTDWKNWFRQIAYAGYRPSNELLFVRDFTHLDPKPRHYQSATVSVIDQHLLALAHALIDSLVKQLRHNFEVRLVTELVLEWEPKATNDWLLKGRHVLNWTIENVQERICRAERAELEAQLSSIGHDAETFVKLLIEAYSGLTLPDLSKRSVLEKLRMVLLSKGVNLTPKPLARIIDLLNRHQPLALAPLRQPEAASRAAGGRPKLRLIEE